MQKMFGLCEATDEAEIDGLLQAGASRHRRARKMLKRIQVFEEGRVPATEARNWKIEGRKRRIT